MSQIVITGTPQFEDLKVLVDMLPESDRVALKQYLQSFEEKDWQQQFDQILARFRKHNYSEQEIKEDVEQVLKEVRSAKKS
jgi:hypothetical protein